MCIRDSRRGYSQVSNEEYYKNAVINKKALIAKLNKANYDKVAMNSNVEVIDGLASFKDEHTVNIQMANGVEEVSAERIFINTGAKPFIPSVEGLEVGKRIHTSETLMNLEDFPKTLTILGSGFIGLEFAATYAKSVSYTHLDVYKRQEKMNEDAIEAMHSVGANSIQTFFYARLPQVMPAYTCLLYTS